VTETAHMHSEVRDRAATSSGTRTPDIFGETAHRIARWTLPVVLGLVYGDWVAVNRRHGGPITSSDLALGVGSTLAFAAIGIAVVQMTRRLRRDLHALHALVRAAFAGVALGFLYSQTGDGMRSVVVTSLATTAVVFLMLFYRYYTGDDA
jgi:peptidoglycan/LPS O-acetylase OafA/YrhL